MRATTETCCGNKSFFLARRKLIVFWKHSGIKQIDILSFKTNQESWISTKIAKLCRSEMLPYSLQQINKF